MTFDLFHDPFPEDFLSPALAIWFYATWPVFLLMFQRTRYRVPVYGTHLSGNLFVYPPKSMLNGEKMDDNKSKRNGSRNRGKSEQSSSFQWVNVPLTDEDYDQLERVTSDLPTLGAMLVGLVSGGYGVTVKYDSERKRFNCTVYRSSGDDNSRSLGLSSHAPDLRDAIAVTLYKFEVKCGGELKPDSVDDSSDKRRQRWG